MDKQITLYPTIEQRQHRYFVVNADGFNNANGHGFKSEQSLQRSYTWWYHNCYEKQRAAVKASKQWKHHDKYLFYRKKKKQAIKLALPCLE
jgi:hypothetical protein